VFLSIVLFALSFYHVVALYFHREIQVVWLFSPLHHLMASLVFSIVICPSHFSIVLYPPRTWNFTSLCCCAFCFQLFFMFFVFVGLFIWNCLVHHALHNKDRSSSFTNEVCFPPLVLVLVCGCLLFLPCFFVYQILVLIFMIFVKVLRRGRFASQSRPSSSQFNWPYLWTYKLNWPKWVTLLWFYYGINLFWLWW